jgi:hypothetical protein
MASNLNRILKIKNGCRPSSGAPSFGKMSVRSKVSKVLGSLEYNGLLTSVADLRLSIRTSEAGKEITKKWSFTDSQAE